MNRDSPGCNLPSSLLFQVRGDSLEPTASSPVTIDGNVFYESYDVNTVDIQVGVFICKLCHVDVSICFLILTRPHMQTHSNLIRNNLALGTYREMANVSRQSFNVRPSLD